MSKINANLYLKEDLCYYLGGEEMNNLVLAYLGDAVYELYVREHLLKMGIANVKDLQRASISYVSAASQCRILEGLIDDNILSEEELTIVKRGRNASSHASKTTDIITYKKATGLECLIGYLYQNDRERCDALMHHILGEKDARMW